MFKKIFILPSIIFMLAESVPAAAQENKDIISYQDYIDSIIAGLPELKANGINLLTQENAVKKAKSLGDISLTSSGTISSARQIQENLGKLDYTNRSLSIGAAKTFTSTGTRLGVNGGYSRTGYENVENGTPDSHAYSAPFLGFTVTQPLLNNFLGKVDSYTEKNAQMQVDVEKARLIVSNISSLNSYRKLYFNWILSLKQIDYSNDSIKSSSVQLNQVRRNYQAGINEEDDFQRATANLLNYEQQLENNLILKNNIERYISVYMDTSNLKPSESDFDSMYSKASAHDFGFVDFENTTSSKIIDLTADRLMYAKGVYRNRTLPELNVNGGYTRRNLTASSSEQFKSFGENDWNVGFEFVYRLGNNQAEGELKDIEIQLQSLDYERSVAVNSYKKNLTSLENYASGTKDLIAKKERYITVLNRQLAAERRKYSQGRLNLSYVITTENQIATEKTNIINLKYQLIGYYIDYLDAIQ